MDKNELIVQLRQKIKAYLNLNGLSDDEFTNTTPLFGDDSLGLDSVDVLELIILLEKEYAISVDEKEGGRNIFFNLETIADYIIKNKK